MIKKIYCLVVVVVLWSMLPLYTYGQKVGHQLLTDSSGTVHGNLAGKLPQKNFSGNHVSVLASTTVTDSGAKNLIPAEAPMSTEDVSWECVISELQEVKEFSGQSEFSYLGSSVAIDGTVAVVGAYREGSYKGSVYVYRFNGSEWQQEAKLMAADGAPNHYFGYAVAISGNNVVVGAYNNGNGAAYVYQFSNNNWQQAAKLSAQGGEAAGNFGWSVGIAGATVVVGAPRYSDAVLYTGAVYVFSLKEGVWQYQTRIVASDRAQNDLFGRSVAVLENTIVVGAPDDSSNNLSASGSAYVFSWDGTAWLEKNKLLAPDAAHNDRFGSAVALSAQQIFVGSPNDDDQGSDSGSVYEFNFNSNNWTYRSKIQAFDASYYDYFGLNLGVSGDKLIVGAHKENAKYLDAGAVYIFENGTAGWKQQAKLMASDGAANNNYGFAVGVSGSAFVVGAPYADHESADAGAVYFMGCPAQTEGNKPPGIVADQSFLLDKTATAGTLVGNIQANDPEGDVLRKWQIVGGNLLDAFKIDASTGSLSVNKPAALEDHLQTGFRLSISVSDGALTDQEDIIVHLTGQAKDFDLTCCTTTDFKESYREADLLNNASYGYNVAIDGNTAVIGNSIEDSFQGAAYVYEKNEDGSWKRVARLSPSDAKANKLFGTAVSVSSSVIIIGARQDVTYGYSGAAYIFERPAGGWQNSTETAKVMASDADESEFFGASVAVYDATAIIGAYGSSEFGRMSGSAYIFERGIDGWKSVREVAKLVPDDGMPNANFGYSVAIHGTTIVVGARGDRESRGAAYVYERPVKGWTNVVQQAKLTAGNATTKDYFGNAVGVSGATIVVGAHKDLGNVGRPGAAYVFEKPTAGWKDATETAVLTASDEHSQNAFGYTVDISGKTIVVGAYGDYAYTGAVYVFERPDNGWQTAKQTQKLIASNNKLSNKFGNSVAISGTHIVAGMHNSAFDRVTPGSAYFFNCPLAVTSNTPPTISNKIFSIDENSANGSEVGAVQAADEEGNVLSYSIISGNTGNAFALNSSTGMITVANTAAIDYETNPRYELTVAVSDGQASSQAQVTILLSNLNDNAPLVDCKPLNVAAQQGCASRVEAKAFDGGATDADGDELTFTVTPAGPYPIGTTAVILQVYDGKHYSQCTTSITVKDETAPTAIVNNLQLVLNEAGTAQLTPDQVDGGSYDYCSAVTATLGKTEFTCADLGTNLVDLVVRDGNGNTATVQATITVVDTQVPRVPDTFEFFVDENSPEETYVGFIGARDNCSISYMLKSASVENAFTVDATGQVLVAGGAVLNYEGVFSYTLTVEVSDESGNTALTTISIRLNNLFEHSPQLGILAAQEILEDELYLFEIPAEAFTDPDEGDVLTYSFVNLPHWLVYDTYSYKLTGTPLNEHVGEYQIVVRATDLGNQSAEQSFSLKVINVNDAPEDIDILGLIISENQPAGTLAGELSTLDVDAGDIHNYSLVWGEGDKDNQRFQISGNLLQVLTPLDYEERQQYSVRIRTTDQAGATFEKIFKISVMDEQDTEAFLPNLFSPNGDLSNDRFILRSKIPEQLHLRIFNRQGRLVYETTDVTEATQRGWDGTCNGIAQPEGTYVWQLTGRYGDGLPLTVAGKTMGNVVLTR
ncbi:putative cell wall-anchored protein [Flammeovirgaceae bacterium 311]|nr:putative cell wall-anchored protein [Flammeovirgaceae bacterium 311]